MAKEPEIAKCIVKKGWTFFDNNRDPKLCKSYEAGDVVSLDLSSMTLGENLRKLTPAEMKLSAAALKKKELGEDEKAIEEDLEPAA